MSWPGGEARRGVDVDQHVPGGGLVIGLLGQLAPGGRQRILPGHVEQSRRLYNNDNLKKMAKNEAEVIAAHYGLTTPVSEANTDAVITDDTA